MSSIKEQQFEYITKFLTEHCESDIVSDIVSMWDNESNKNKFESSFPQFELSTKKKSSAKKKDPNAPKRAKSSYNCFCEANREKVKTKYPEEKGAVILSKLGAEWTALKALCDAGDEDSVEEMKIYTATAAQSKADYTAAMAAYTPPSDEELANVKPKKESKPKAKATKDSKEPTETKKPPTNYNLFTKDRKANMTDFQGTHKEFMQLTGAEWKAHKKANDEVFQHFTQMSDKLKQDSGIVQKAPSAKKPVKKTTKQPVLSDIEDEEEDEDEDEEDVVKVPVNVTITPKKRPISPLFKKFAAVRRKELREEIKESGEIVGAAKLTDMILAEWKEMDEKDLEVYQE